MARRKLEDPNSTGIYFTRQDKDVDFFSSGDPVLDCVLGGGWAVGRIGNLVGDKSTGKTLLAIEAMANFAKRYKDSRIIYAEAESAFDKSYAAALGMPIDRVEFKEDYYTVEDFFLDLEKLLDEKDKASDNTPSLYVLDSLDALSDKAELARDIDEGTYGATKPKQLSEIFRRLVKKLGKSNVTLLIVSQVRDNIGATFGRKTKRSGGRALDFYASQVIYLAQLEAIKKTKNKVTRQIGVAVRAKCDKNKVGLPYRQCDFDIIFGFGIEALMSCVGYLEEVNRLEDAQIEDVKKYRMSIPKMSDEEYFNEIERLSGIIRTVWEDVENAFMPTRKKY